MAEFVSADEMERLRDILDDLLDVESGLTNKEVDFIENLTHWDGCFTTSQAKYLEKIYERRLG